MIGDGLGLPITHSSSTSLSTPYHTFSLQNVLYAPNMHKHRISISQFCSLNNTYIEFLPFFVKDLRTGAIFLQGQTKNYVYEWLISSKFRSSPLVAFFSVKTTSSEWHHILGHLSSSILRHLVSRFNLELSSPLSLSFNCNACQCNKSHKLPFSVSTLTFSSPLQIIFSYVWTSPVYSIDNFKYYVIFVDHFIK